MSEMSPLGRLLMNLLYKGSWAAAVLIAVFAGILVYQRLTPEGSLAFVPGDFGFLAVLAALFSLAVYLVRGIRREIDHPGGQ
jgi:polyferredoxin